MTNRYSAPAIIAIVIEFFVRPALVIVRSSRPSFHLASITAGGPAPLIATALFAWTGSGYTVAAYIFFCGVVSVVASVFMPDYTNRDISQEVA